MARSSWGSVRSKGRGIWEIRYKRGGERKSLTFRGTRKEADKKLAELRTLYEGKEDGSMPIKAFFYSVFIPECERRVEGTNDDKMSLTTLSGYKRIFRASIERPLGDIPLEDLDGKTVQAWLDEMTAGKAAHAKSVLKTIMRRADDLDYINGHVMGKRYLMPSEMTSRARTKDVYSEKELNEIAEEAKDEWWIAAFIMAGFGGGQRAEVTGVKPEEVSFPVKDGKTFALVPILRGVHLLDGKVEVLDHAKNEYREENLIIEEPHSLHLKEIVEACDAEWLLDDGFGRPVDPEALARAYKSWLAKSTHRYIPFGNLRNAYSTMMHERGLDGDTVHKLMRHATNTTDYRHYNRMSDDALMQRLMDNPKS